MALGKFLPIDDMQRVFREFFLEGLRKLHRCGKLVFPDQWRAIEAPADFEKWLSPLAETRWVIRLRSVWNRTGPEDVDAAARTVEYLRCRSANLTHVCSDQLTHCLERGIGVDGFFLFQAALSNWGKAAS
jgi:hypothetical protein